MDTGALVFVAILEVDHCGRLRGLKVWFQFTVCYHLCNRLTLSGILYFEEKGNPSNRPLRFPSLGYGVLLGISHVGATFVSAWGVCMMTLVIDFWGFGVLDFI